LKVSYLSIPQFRYKQLIIDFLARMLGKVAQIVKLTEACGALKNVLGDG
jgi:hypothetical protein